MPRLRSLGRVWNFDVVLESSDTVKQHQKQFCFICKEIRMKDFKRANEKLLLLLQGKGSRSAFVAVTHHGQQRTSKAIEHDGRNFCAKGEPFYQKPGTQLGLKAWCAKSEAVFWLQFSHR